MSFSGHRHTPNFAITTTADNMKKYDLHLKGFVGGWDFDADYVDYILEKYADRHVDVLMDSPGGYISTALTIANAFRRHGDVTVHFAGVNASAATVASLGAKEITMDRMACYMIHRGSVDVIEFSTLNAEQIQQKCEELQKKKDALETLDNIIAASYAQRSTKTPEEIKEAMSNETWFTPEQALEWGFIDKITEYEEDAAPILDTVTAQAFIASGVALPPIALKNSDKSPIAALISKIIAAFTPKNTTMEKETKPTQDPQPKDEAKDPQPKNTAEDIIAQKDAKIAELENRIKDLEKQPAQEQQNVVDTPKADTHTSDFCNSVKSASELFNSLP